jgi:hypothetical protein
MWINRHKYFRWTGRTARITFAYVVAFPAFIGYWAYVTDVSWISLSLSYLSHWRYWVLLEDTLGA